MSTSTLCITCNPWRIAMICTSSHVLQICNDATENRSLELSCISLIEIDPDSKVPGANMGPTGPRWAPCGPREPCYLGMHALSNDSQEFFTHFFIICLIALPQSFGLAFFLDIRKYILGSNFVGLYVVWYWSISPMSTEAASHAMAPVPGERLWWNTED